jgi:ABC-type sugar transport system ATPase subunit
LTLVLSDISKRFGGPQDDPVLDGVSLEVGDGQMTVIVGPSGSGKTTLLRCVAGLEDVDSGSVAVGGRDVTGAPPGERDVAMVFQDYALYPHLSVAENIAFGLRARKAPRTDVDRQVTEAASKVGLGAVLTALPGRLSGGERQRVALARALVRRPAAFLLDEPLSNLDAELRTQTRREIKELQRSLQTTTLYVTHDQVEALTLGDQVAVLREGRIEQVASPTELYERPATTFVARFIGSPPMNLLPGAALDREGETLGLRPERVALVGAADGRLHGEVTVVEPIGGDAIVRVGLKHGEILLRVDLRRAPSAGERVGLAFTDSAVHRFDERGQRVR